MKQYTMGYTVGLQLCPICDGEVDTLTIPNYDDKGINRINGTKRVFVVHGTKSVGRCPNSYNEVPKQDY